MKKGIQYLDNSKISTRGLVLYMIEKIIQVQSSEMLWYIRKQC